MFYQRNIELFLFSSADFNKCINATVHGFVREGQIINFITINLSSGICGRQPVISCVFRLGNLTQLKHFGANLHGLCSFLGLIFYS